MQPILSITAPAAGMVYVNGRFAGEARAQEPLTLPVCAWGALYLEFHPLEQGWRSMARRLTLSGGRVLEQGLERDVFAVEWPGGVTEIELVPPEESGPERRQTRFEQGMSYALVEAGDSRRLEVGGLEIDLPEGAGMPSLARQNGQLLFVGPLNGGGSYLAAISGDGKRRLGQASGSGIEIDGALVRVIVGRGDVVGHARLENWRLTEDALVLESSENVWENGAPRWPATAEETVLAALQAGFLGLAGEAEGYLAPQSAGSGRIAECIRGFEGCTALKFARPDARAAVGLLRTEAPNCARVVPLYYRAAPMGGMQGAWRIEMLEF